MMAVDIFSQVKAQYFAGDTICPHQVATAEHLNNVRSYLSFYFIRTADIDLDVSRYNEGDGWEPIGTSAQQFSDSYDGQQYVISKLIGMAGCISGSVSLNVGLAINCYSLAYAAATSGTISAGGITRRNYYGMIENCYAAAGVDESIIRQELPAAAQYQVDLSRYQPGIYLVRVIQGREAGVLKVVRR